MKEVQIKNIAVNYMVYKLNDVFVKYDNGQGVLDSNDDVINDYIKLRHTIFVVKDDGSKVRLDYKYTDGKVVIANSYEDLA